MKELTKLVQIVTKRSQKESPLLNFDEKKPGKELQLFQEIQNGSVSVLPKNKKKNPDTPQVRMLRARLRRKLLNHLYFLNFNEAHLKVANRYDIECTSLLYQANILIKEGDHQISEKLIRAALKTAQEAEFTNHVLNATDLLRFLYVQSGNLIAFRKISLGLEKTRELLQKEQQAENLYYVAKLEMNQSVNARKKYIPKLLEAVTELENLWQQYNSFNLFELYYKTNIWYHESTDNFARIIAITTESEKMLAAGTINEKRFDGRYNKYISVYAHLRARHYEQGLQFAEAYTEAFNRSTNNWFAFMENYFLLAMHAGRYDVAGKVIGEVGNNPFLGKITKAAKERWELYRSYLYFIQPSQALLRQFNYQAFIMATPEYSKDKQGFNVAILILQFLHFLKAHEIEPLLYRIESLKKYSGRHFKDSFSIRSQLFFKLLMLVVKEDMDPDRCRRKGSALAAKLAATPTPGDAYAEIEIIPYERLWEETLQMLARFEEKDQRR